MSLPMEEFKNLEIRNEKHIFDVKKQKYRQHGRGKTKRKDDYILVKDYNHQNSDCQGWIREHRLVMSNHLGRPLTKQETVHHKNGIKSDNRIENLRLFRNLSEHREFETTIYKIDIEGIIRLLRNERIYKEELAMRIMTKIGCGRTTAIRIIENDIDKLDVKKRGRFILVKAKY